MSDVLEIAAGVAVLAGGLVLVEFAVLRPRRRGDAVRRDAMRQGDAVAVIVETVRLTALGNLGALGLVGVSLIAAGALLQSALAAVVVLPLWGMATVLCGLGVVVGRRREMTVYRTAMRDDG